MRTMTSVEFRKGYAKLTEAAEVTANGHHIGVWIPAALIDRAISEPVVLREAAYVTATRKAQQAERDRILRAVNKGG